MDPGVILNVKLLLIYLPSTFPFTLRLNNAFMAEIAIFGCTRLVAFKCLEDSVVNFKSLRE